VTDPGKILDLLDEGVIQTLRQDQGDAATKDGMDIALCRINTKTNVVEYAGAHRPLYAVIDGALQEIKGNMFPVGGGVFRNQTNFKTTRIQMSAGDSVYFSSDGFPDQFGGPDGRKLGPKRVRELVMEMHEQPPQQAALNFDGAWEIWRGNHKQTDDMLLIGITF
jgi:serine phosphatase RsbU (regulator of sigma subunit)